MPRLRSLESQRLGVAGLRSRLCSRSFLGCQLTTQFCLGPLALLVCGTRCLLVLLLRLFQRGCLLGAHLHSLRRGLRAHRQLSFLSLIKHALHQLRAVLRRCERIGVGLRAQCFHRRVLFGQHLLHFVPLYYRLSEQHLGKISRAHALAL
eukprot:scaffold63577_cov81-Phaeocystis_antarctica.AAC.2